MIERYQKWQNNLSNPDYPKTVQARTDTILSPESSECRSGQRHNRDFSIHVGPIFLYDHKRNREVNVNLAFLKGAYTGGHVRANLAIQVGTYAQYNYAAEQGLKTPFLTPVAG